MNNWKTWLKGMVAAAISGAGTGLAALSVGISWKQAGQIAAVSSVIGVGLYLKQSPLP